MKIIVETVKSRWDQEKYIRVNREGFYLIIIKDKESGKVIRKVVRRPIIKKVRGREYRYLRIYLPWFSTISSAVGYKKEYPLVLEIKYLGHLNGGENGEEA